MASYRQRRKAGTWEVRWELPLDPLTGKRRQDAKSGFRSKEDAEAWFIEHGQAAMQQSVADFAASTPGFSKRVRAVIKQQVPWMIADRVESAVELAFTRHIAAPFSFDEKREGKSWDAVEAMRYEPNLYNAWAKNGTVYFLQGVSTQQVKIGVAQPDVLVDRISTIRNFSADPLRLLRVLPGGYPLENLLHKTFADARTHGEWFYPYKPLIDFIDETFDLDLRIDFQASHVSGRVSLRMTTE